jgi:hypothetical protein
VPLPAEKFPEVKFVRLLEGYPISCVLKLLLKADVPISFEIVDGAKVKAELPILLEE